MKSSYLYPDKRIIVFAREPVQGKVKTRLIPFLGEKGALQLYEQLLDHALESAIQSTLCSVEICISPESNKNYFLQYNLNITIQQGDNLGDRMFHAMQSALEQHSGVILMGSDCPFLSQTELHKSILALNSHDMVFTPAYDGGYVLVGAKKINPIAFENIQWGSEHVMQQTREVLSANGISWKEMTTLNDIDTGADLKHLSALETFKR